MALQRVAQLVIAEAQSGGSGALVKAASGQGIFEEGALISVDRAAQVAGL